MNDTRILRERVAYADDAIDALGGDLDAAAALLGVTTTVGTYPTAAAAYYALNPAQLTGTETEGGADTPTADTSTTLYALNVGSQIPPDGTAIVVHAVGNRYVFRYDG